MKKFLILILLLPIQYMYGRDKLWSLDDCVQYAVEHNPKRIQQEAQNKMYAADKLEAVGSFIPSLNAQTTTAFNFGRVINEETNTYVNVNQFSNPYYLYSNLTLFDGLSNVYRLKKSNIYKSMGVEQLQDTKDLIALETMELFFNVMYYQGVVKLAQQQLDESQEEVRKIERMQELGLKSIPDLTEIEAKEAEDRFLLTRQQNALTMEMIRLKTKMNFPIDEELHLNEHEQTNTIHSINNDVMQIYHEALTHLPKALTSEKQLSAKEMDYKIAKGNVLPRIAMEAGVNTVFSRFMNHTKYESFTDQWKNRQGSYVSITLYVPLFNGFSRTANIKRSKQQLVIAQSQHEETLRTVYSDIEQAVADVNGLADEYHSAKKRSDSMDAAHQVNQRKYDEGLISALELNTSANRLLNAKVEELYTGLKYQLKYRLLEYYKGESLLN